MTLVTTQVDTHTPTDVGPTLQCALTAVDMGLAASIAASPAWITSNKIPANGYKAFAFGITSSQAAGVSIQRYLDAAATIPQGDPLTLTLLAATAAVINSNDGRPFQSMVITVTNNAGSIATLSNVLLLLQSQ